MSHSVAHGTSQALAGFSVRTPVVRTIAKRVYRHISQSCCPWNVKFSHELAKDPPFRARVFVEGKDAMTLATDILALDQDAFSAAFRKSPMKRAKSDAATRSSFSRVAPSRAIVDIP